MRDTNRVEEKIIETLREHPEGLTILNIAKLIGIHRHTATKYIYYLVGTEAIYQRDVGPAKLCYLKEIFTKPGKEAKILEKMKERLEE